MGRIICIPTERDGQDACQGTGACLGDIVAFERERRQPFMGRMNAIRSIRASAMRIGSAIFSETMPCETVSKVIV